MNSDAFNLRVPGLCLLLLALMILSPAASAQTLTHRYSFFNETNGSTTVADSVGAANGSLQGAAVISGGQLVLNGSSGCYAKLPGGLFTGDSAVTVEAWADYGALPVNSYLFSFGNTDSGGAGEDYIFCAPQAARITISGVDPGWEGEQNAYCGGWSGRANLHVVAIFNPPANYMAVYTNGVLAGANDAVTTTLAPVHDVYSYIGRSLYTVDPYAPIKVDEFRIYNGPLSAPQIALDAASGPAQIVTSPGALLSIQLALTNQMVAGSTQQAVLTGNFANVSNVNLFAYGQPGLVSSNTNVVAVSSSGLLSAVAPGAAALIVASYGGLSVTQSVAVAGFATNRFIFDSFGDGFWTVSNQGNGKALVASFSGAGQEPYTNGATEQQFEVLYNLQNATFRLRQRSTWFCLGAKNSQAVPGGGAPLVFYTGVSAQQWRIVDAGGGCFRIFNAASNLVLQTDNGAAPAVTLAAPSGSAFQLWQFNYQTHYPKKGCAGYEGDYSPFGLAWAYNYNDNTGVALPASVDFAPMIHDANWEPLSDVQSRAAGWRVQVPPDYLLTYNEPDNSTQANMTTNQVIGLWPQLQALNVPLVSPATQDTEDAWENGFFSQIGSQNFRVDYTAVHEYVPPNASSLISDLYSVYTAYGRPVWLTEFSPVDWSGCQCWSENDDYNFLAEFMWQAEGQDWLKRYAIFPFSGTNSASPWVDNGYTGTFFQPDGATLTPYGELYATWDGDLALHSRTAYFIHNLGASFRLTGTHTMGAPVPATIYMTNATAQWALLPAPATNHWYIISLNDGRRLRNDGGTLDLAPVGTTNASVDWWFNGPDSSGYYYLDNLAASQSIRATGTAPAITFSMINDPAPSTATQWRLIKPYQPVSITAPVTPGGLSAEAGDQTVTLGWSGSVPFFNVYRATVSGGPYAQVSNARTNTAFADTAVVDGVAYYYVVTGLNILGEESPYSAEIAVRPVSLSQPQLSFGMTSNGVQLAWPSNHTGWELQAQTNPPGVGISSNWVTVSGTAATNQIVAPISTASGSVFFRLMYP